MARVTVEDCVELQDVPNRFRTGDDRRRSGRATFTAGVTWLTVERDNDKNPVVALREIAEKTVVLEELNEALIQNLQKFVEADEPEEDAMDFDLPTSEAMAQAAMAEAVAPAAPDLAAAFAEAEGAGEQAPRIVFEDVQRKD